MDKKNMQQLIIMMPIILIAGIFCYYKYLLVPLNADVGKINSELETIKKEYRESETRASRLPKLEKEIVILNMDITEIEKKLPPNKDVPSLIRLLSKKMNANSIEWSRLAPGTQNVKDYYIEHSYTIPFKTTYHHLGAFLAEIGQMERIFATRFNKLSNYVDAKTGTTMVQGDLIFLIYTSKG